MVGVDGGAGKTSVGLFWSSFQSRKRLKAETVVLRHQPNILKWKASKCAATLGDVRGRELME
jgi:hypothetical protein